MKRPSKGKDRVIFGEQHPREYQLAVARRPIGRLVERSHRVKPVLRSGSGRVWEAATGKEKLTRRQPAETWATAVSPSPTTVGSRSARPNTRLVVGQVWDVAAGR